MATEKCPYCFRPLGTWLNHDPIFLPNGAKYKWDTDTSLIEVPLVKDRIYKGFCQICESEVQEIQDVLKQLEIDNLSVGDRTTFSLLNTSGKFQILGKHIKEMRDSVEKLLTEFGLTKTDYFNYDEEGNLITQPNGSKLDWTDPITNAVDLKKFQVKYIHIEDLRHYIQTFWHEYWTNAEPTQNISWTYPQSWFLQYFDIQGDHLWNNNSASIGIQIAEPEFGHTIIGSASGNSLITIVPNNVTCDCTFSFSGLTDGINSHFFDIVASTFLNLSCSSPEIRRIITSSTKISWDGVSTSSGNLIYSPSHVLIAQLYFSACITLTIYSYSSHSYGTLYIWYIPVSFGGTPGSSWNWFISNWAGNNILIYDIIDKAGTVSGSYLLTGIDIHFWNYASGYIYSPSEGHITTIDGNLTSSININNIKIK